MAKRLIHLYGASGSGTSSLGRYIAEKSGCFFMDTDDYYWAPTNPPFTLKRTPEERLELINKELEKHEKVVLSGSLVGWGDELIPDITFAIRVVTDTDTRLQRIKQREKARFGARIEQGGDMYETHVEFLKWASEYDTGGINMRSKLRHDEWQKLLTCPICIVDGSESFENNYIKIKKFL